MVFITEGRKLSWRDNCEAAFRGGGPKRLPVDNFSCEPRPSNPLVMQNSVAAITKCFTRCLREHRSDGATDKLSRTPCPGVRKHSTGQPPVVGHGTFERRLIPATGHCGTAAHLGNSEVVSRRMRLRASVRLVNGTHTCGTATSSMVPRQPSTTPASTFTIFRSKRTSTWCTSKAHQ